MVFEPGKSNLKEIHNLMTKINDLKNEPVAMNQCEQDLLVQHISGTFSLFADRKNKNLIAIELALIAINADLRCYEEKVKALRLELEKLQTLKKENQPV